MSTVYTTVHTNMAMSFGGLLRSIAHGHVLYGNYPMQVTYDFEDPLFVWLDVQ